MSLHRKVATAFLFFGLAAVAGCTTAPQQNDFPPIAFDDKAPFRLDVAEVVMEQAYVAPNEAPNVEHLFPETPADAALRWAGDRLVAEGTSRRAVFVVRDASVVEESLETEEGLSGFLTVDQSERYSSNLEVELQIYDGTYLQGTAKAQAKRSVTVPEDLTLQEREAIWYQLTKDTVADLNRELEQVISSTYGTYLL
jgi:hypothetical protein